MPSNPVLAGTILPELFVTWDIAFVFLCSSLPIAVMLLIEMQARVRPLTRFAAGVTMLTGVAVLIIEGRPVAGLNRLMDVPLQLRLWMTAAGLLAAVGITMIFSSLTFPVVRAAGSSRRQLAGGLLCGVMILWIVPSTYIAARVQHDARQIIELINQSRLGDASELAFTLMLLDSNVRTSLGPLRTVQMELEQSIRQAESRLAGFHETPDSADAAIQYARDLAILGRNATAISRLLPLLESESAAEASGLLGTIHETQQQWPEALAYYMRAQSLWVTDSRSAEQKAGQIQATRGIAYCSRKLGAIDAAESAYRNLLELSPNADTHFLLAQFYEDTQQTDLAYQHVRKAMYLAPERYEREGRRLIDKLQTLHFGCLNVYDQEYDRR